jgi:hypothetical protein
MNSVDKLLTLFAIMKNGMTSVILRWKIRDYFTLYLKNFDGKENGIF